MRIHVFSTGRVRRTRADRGVRRYFVDDWGEETLPVNIFVLEHPDGLCLVDTGQVSDAAQPGYFPPWYPFFRLSKFELEPRDEAAAQMAAAGLDVAHVRWVVLTHMHTDHVGGLAAFRHAEVVVTRTEWAPAQGWPGRLRGYLPQRWPQGITPRIADFTGAALGPFAGTYDVAGDGRMLLVPLPGHSPGHSGLLVRLAPMRSCLFAGDAALRARELVDAAPVVADWCRHENIQVLTSHDDDAPRIASELSADPF